MSGEDRGKGGLGVGLVLLGLIVAGLIGLAYFRRSAGPPPPVYGEVSGFTLTNQQGRPFSLEDLEGRIWVADLIFTRCPGPCLKMTRSMRELQDRLPSDLPVTLVTLTVDPEYDVPSILQKYAERFRATNHWEFLTGAKSVIYQVATNQFKVAVEDKGGEIVPAERFFHSTRLVVVDPRGHVRGFVDGSDAAAVDEAADLVKRVANEFSL